LANFGLSALGAGMAGAAIGFAGRGLANMAQEAQKLKKELSDSNVTTGEIADRLAGTVPIMGEVWKAGREWHEVLTGSKEQISLINEEAAITGRLFDATAARATLMHNAIAGNASVAGSRGFAASIQGMGGYQAALATAGYNYQQRKIADKATDDEQRKSIQAAIAKEFAEKLKLAENERAEYKIENGRTPEQALEYFRNPNSAPHREALGMLAREQALRNETARRTAEEMGKLDSSFGGLNASNENLNRADITTAMRNRRTAELEELEKTENEKTALMKRMHERRDSELNAIREIGSARDRLDDLQSQRQELLNPTSNYRASGERSIGGRFSTGQNELLLMRTANTDTARSTGNMDKTLSRIERLINDMNDIISQKTSDIAAYDGGG
jgi:hypothetical protein